MLVLGSLGAQPSLNVDLFGEFNRGDIRYSGSWYYVDADGVEYALIGARTGLAANKMDDPALPEVGFIPGPESNWREITVIGDHAYVVTEGTGPGEGMQVIDLTYLPDSLHLLTTYTATFTDRHIIQKNNYEDEPYVYLNGGCGDCGIQILDVSDPANPVLVGEYDPGYYIHDCFIKNDQIFACAFYEAKIDVIDIADKTNPVLITSIPDPGSNTHSVWLTEDDRHLVICDELDGLPSRFMNVEDIENPFVVGPLYSADFETLVHNPYIRGNYIFYAHNSAGLTVVDIRDATLPVEVGYFDTWDGDSPGSHGLWSACPFPPSGKIIGGDRTRGLMVWEFNNTQAARFYGVVKDSLTGEVLMNAEVLLLPNNEPLALDFDGQFKFGALAENGFALMADAPDYQAKNVWFDLLEGDSLWFEIELVPDDYMPVAVDELSKNGALEVFPNPSTGTFYLDLSTVQGAKSLEIYDVNKNLILKKKVEQLETFTIDLKNKATGMYWLQVLNEDNAVVGSGELLKF